MPKETWVLKTKFLLQNNQPWITTEYDNIHEAIAEAKHKIFEGDEVNIYQKSLKKEEHLEPFNSYEYAEERWSHMKKAKEQ